MTVKTGEKKNIIRIEILKNKTQNLLITLWKYWNKKFTFGEYVTISLHQNSSELIKKLIKCEIRKLFKNMKNLN